MQHTVRRYGSRIVSSIVMSCVVILSGCSTASSTSTVRVQDWQFDLPSALISVSKKWLDQAHVASSILSAWKNGKTSLILAAWPLPAATTIQEFTTQSQKRLSQEILGYIPGTSRKRTITCNNTKLIGYMVTFQQSHPGDTKTIINYVSQFYVQKAESVYVLSLADTEENTILTDIVDTLHCVQP